MGLVDYAYNHSYHARVEFSFPRKRCQCTSCDHLKLPQHEKGAAFSTDKYDELVWDWEVSDCG